MGKNYYRALGVAREATVAAIKAAYRKKALEWHPEKHSDDDDEREAAKQTFALIAEAYTVLSNARLRAIFDQFGEKVLKKGMPNDQGDLVGAWSFNTDPMDVYQKFFGTRSPFADVLSASDASEVLKALHPHEVKSQAKPQPMMVNLYCNLEELFLGCTKKVKMSRLQPSPNGKGTFAEQKIFTLEIQPGYKAGTQITFPDQGDHVPGQKPADVTFVVREKPHPHFVRRKHDLIYTVNLSLSKALTGCTVDVPLLDGAKLPIAISEIVNPHYTKTIRGHGMPNPRKAGQRGDLVLRFEVRFPVVLSEETKVELKKLLPA